jgi:D-glycero-D-manno-heptose 1,7-bisphosphate phosphatase
MKAIFFDRDGTLNIDTGYINDPGAVSLYASVPQVLREIKDQRYGIFIITNQSGISRGFIKPEEYRDVHEKFISLIGDDIIDEILFCPHSPVHECSCRKPQFLLLEIVKENYHIDCSQSFFVGDKPTDILCGKNFGLKTVLIVTSDNASRTDLHGDVQPDYTIGSFSELLQIVR